MNNKGIFKDNKPDKKGFKSFMKESGFYIAIVVGLCVLAAGAVYFSTNQFLTDPNDDPYIAEENPPNNDYNLGLLEDDPFENLPDQSSINEGPENFDDNPYIGMEDLDNDPGDNNLPVDKDPDKPYDANIENAGSETSGEEPSTSTVGDSEFNDDLATEDVVLAIGGPMFKVPAAGKIQSEYSMEKLVFSPTFNEWRTHSGVDIAAPRGEVVRSIGNGTILEVKNDPRYGFTIVIDHNNGYKSIYSNLASDQTIQVGQEVKISDPIGAVGATAIFESAEPTHLHFELYKENKLVDPAAYIDFN